MKKLTMLLLAAALTLCPLFALAAQETISVYNWGDYIEPEVLDLFEQETGIKVIYETFETNEDMYAKIAMGGSSYDVIIPSDYMIERMIQENLLQKINWENIPNVANIDPRFMNEGYDPQSEYAVPYTWGTMGILYNTEMVDEADLHDGHADAQLPARHAGDCAGDDGARPQLHRPGRSGGREEPAHRAEADGAGLRRGRSEG